MGERAAQAEGSAQRRPSRGSHLVRSDWVVVGLSVVLTAIAGVLHYLGGGAVWPSWRPPPRWPSWRRLSAAPSSSSRDRFGPGATGVLQSALGNLPELFISLFALQAGPVAVVQAALIGSIFANLLLVLGLCFVVGGLKHGTQTLDSARARGITVMLLVSAAAW
jgi:Ca2+:H+ antiporter